MTGDIICCEAVTYLQNYYPYRGNCWRLTILFLCTQYCYATAPTPSMPFTQLNNCLGPLPTAPKPSPNPFTCYIIASPSPHLTYSYLTRTTPPLHLQNCDCPLQLHNYIAGYIATLTQPVAPASQDSPTLGLWTLSDQLC